MRGIVLFVVIVTVSSVRSLHPQPKGENNRVKGGTPVSSNFDRNSLGPTKTKKGKRPSRIGNIDVNYIRTIGADIDLRKNAQNSDSVSVDVKQNKSPVYLSSFQKGEPPGYNKNDSYISKTNADGSNYKTNKAMLANFINIYSTGGTQSSANVGMNNFNDGGYLSPELHAPVINRDSKQEYQSRIQPKTTSWKSLQQKNLSNKIDYQYRQEQNTANQQQSNSKFTLKTFSSQNNRDQAYDPFKPDFGIPDQKDYTKVKTTTGDVKTASYDKVDNTKGLYLSPQKDVSKENSFKTANNNDTRSEKQFKLKTNYQVSKQTDLTSQNSNLSPNKPYYDFGRPDRPEVSKPKSSYQTTGKGSIKVAQKPDLLKPDFNRPDQSDNNGYKQPTKQVKQTDKQNQIKVGKNQSLLKTSTSNDYLNKENQNAKIVLDTFKTLYQAKLTDSGYKPSDLSKPDFNRPDKSDPLREVNRPQTYKDKPSYDFGRPDKPSYKSKSDFEISQNIAYQKDVKSQTITNGKSLYDFGKPEKPDQKKTIYKNVGKPDFSTPDFNRPDKLYPSKQKPDFLKPDFSRNENTRTLKQDYSQQIKIGLPDMNKSKYESVIKSSIITQGKPDFNRPDIPDTTKQDYNTLQKQVKPTYDFGKPDMSDKIKPSYKTAEKSFDAKVVKPDISKPDFNRPDKLDTSQQDYKQPQEVVKPKYDFGRPELRDQTEPSYKSAGITLDVHTAKTDLSKPDFNRPDKPDTSQHVYKQPKKQVKSAYDFGRPDVPDKIKPSVKSARKIFVEKDVKPVIPKPDFNRPDKPDASIQGYNKQAKEALTSYDFSRIDKSVKTEQSYQQVDNRKKKVAQNSYISKPEFKKPDQPDITKQDFISQTKQIKRMYDFGKPDRSEQYKPNYESAGKPVVVKSGKHDMFKPDFNRQEKSDLRKQTYKSFQKQSKQTYDFGKPDFNRPDQPDIPMKDFKTPTKHSQPTHDFGKPGKPDISKPDFNRPDKPDTPQQDYKQPKKQVKPKFDFGKQDMPDQHKTIYESGGKPVVKYGKPDISKPDFSRPDQLDTSNKGYNKQLKSTSISFDLSRSDQSAQTQQKYKQGENQNTIDLEKFDITKPDFNRPDKPDITKQDYKTPTKQIKPAYDFGKPDVPLQYKPTLKSARKPVVLKPGKPNISKTDFNRPDTPETSQQNNKQQKKRVKPSYDFGKPDVPDTYKPNYESAGKLVIKYGKPDISKPDFNRPDQPDISQQVYKQPQKQVKPTFDFGRPDVPDQSKPSYKSGGKTFVLKAVKPDISKPDFNRPDKPDALSKGYNKQTKQTMTSYEFSKIDSSIKTQQNNQQGENRYNIDLRKPEMTKPDFNRPDQPDITVQDYRSPANQIQPSYDFGKPDVPDQYKPSYKSAGKTAVKPGKPDISKPDFNRPEKPDTLIKGYNKQLNVDSTSYDFSVIDKSVETQRSYQQDVNRNAINLQKPDLTKPDFNRPDRPDITKQDYKTPTKQIKPTYDFGKPDVPDQYKPNYKSAGKPVVKYGKPDISKPDFNRPDQPDSSQQVYKQPQKQVKPTFDFGRPDVPDQSKPSYKSGGNSFVFKAVKPDISKPDFNRPDKPDALSKGFNMQPKQTMTSYEFNKIDNSIKTQQNNQQGENRYNTDLQKPDMSKPDLNRPDQPDITVQDYRSPANQIKPSYDFGKPDVPDQYKPSYKSAGKTVVKPGKPDITKPDFNRPDKPETAIKGYNKQLKVDSTSYDFSVIDKFVETQRSYQQDVNRNAINLQKPDLTKPDFNRPDRPDITKQDYKTPTKQIKPTYDFGKPDVPDQYKPNYKSAGKPVVKYGKPDISKPDFNRPDQPDSSQQVNKQPQKQVKPTFDFGRPDVPEQSKPSYKSGGNSFVLKAVKPDISKPDFNRPDKPDALSKGFNMQPKQTMTSYEFNKIDNSIKTQQNYQQGENRYNTDLQKPDMSKPDFNRPDQPDITVQDYRSPANQIKPSYDFGKQDVPDQYKPSYKSAGKTVVKPGKPDITKPDFNRPDKPETAIKGYNKQLQVDSTSYDFSVIDKFVETQRSYQQDVNRNAINLQKPDLTKPDFNRPDRPDITKQDYKTPTKQIKPTYDFGKPDVPDQYKPNYKSAGKPVVKYGKPDISKPEFNRPDQPDTSQQIYKQPQKQVKATYDFRTPDVPDQSKPSYKSGGKTFVLKAVKPDISKPDFNRPDKPDALSKGYNKQPKQTMTSYEFSKIDNSIKTQQNYQQGENRYNTDLQKPEISKPDFNRPDQPDITVQDYRSPANQIQPSYDFGKPDVPDQYKPSYKSAGKTVVKPGKPDISKPDFNRPDKPDTAIKGYNKQLNVDSTSYDFSVIDKSVETQRSYQQDVNRNAINLQKPDLTKPDFNRPDRPDITKQDYKTPIKQIKPTYDFGKPDVPDQYKPNYKSAGKLVVKYGKPDISKPDFNRPDQPDTSQQNYKQPQKQVKTTYDFGRPDVPDQSKPSYKSGGKTFVLKAVKPDISKPDFNRPDKPDALSKGYNKQPKQTMTSYEFSKIDNSIKTQQNYQQGENRYNTDLQKPEISKPDFNRPDQPDITVQDYRSPANQIQPSYDFGKPDVPDRYKPSYKSAGKTVVKPGKPDISKPDFNRPDKPDTAIKGYNKQLNVDSTSYDFSVIDKSVETQRSYQQDVNRNAINLQKPDLTKPDFSRPDRPDITKQDYKTPIKQIKPTYDFGKPDVPDQYKSNYESAKKPVVKYSKPDISKPDFNRPDQPDTSQQIYKQPQKQVKPTYDFGRPDVPDQNKPSYKSGGKTFVLKEVKPEISKPDFNRPDKPDALSKGYNKQPKQTMISYELNKIDNSIKTQKNYQQGENRYNTDLKKPEISKPDFNRPDQPDITVQDYRSPANQIQPSYDFGKPDVPDQYKPSYKSAGKTVVKPGKPDITKPDFNRPDKPDTAIKGYNEQLKVDSTSYDFSVIDKSVETQRSYQQDVNRNAINLQKPDLTKPDFNRPDRPDITKQDYKTPTKQIKPTYDFGKPDVPDQYKSNYESAGKPVVKYGKPDISKPDFNRPDQPDTSQQVYKQPQKQVKPTYDLGRPDVPDQSKPSYKSGGNSFVLQAVKPDISKPDFNRPDKPDALSKGFNKQREQTMTSYEFSKIDNSIKTQQNYQQGANRYNTDLQKPEMSKPDFNRPDQPDITVQDYRFPANQIQPSYDFGKPDVPDQYKPSYKSAGKTVVKPGKPDITKPDFNRPDKPDTAIKGNNKQLKVDSPSYDFSVIDKSVETQRSYQQDVNRNAINLQKPDLTKPDFNRPDRPDITKQDYRTPTKQIKPTYDFGKPDVPDQYKPNYESAGKPVVKYSKPDISKPDFNRPDQPDTSQQVYKQPQKQVKPTFDFGRPGVPDQSKPSYKSGGKTFVLKAVKPDISKPDFNRPDKPDAQSKGYNKQSEQTMTSYEFSKIDNSIKTQQNYQQGANRYNTDLQKPEMSKPDFNRPDQPDITVQDYRSPANQIQPSYDFGKPDVPDQYKPSYKSAGKTVVKPVKPDITKPDFNRPSYDLSKIDKSVEIQRSYQKDVNRNVMNLQKADTTKPDFNRPHRPDITKKDYKTPTKQIKPTYDFGKPEVPDQYKPNYESAGKPVVKYGKPGISKPDFNRPDQPDTSQQVYKQLQKQVKTSYEFSKIDNSIKTQQNYQQGQNRYNIDLQKPEMSKPDFNRPDQPDITIQDNKSPASQIKPSYDFGKPDVPDQYKPSYKSAGKSVVKPGKPDITKPDFNRPDQTDITVKNYGSPVNQIKATYNFGKPDVPDQNKPSYESAGKPVVKYDKPDITKPDFNRPDKTDASIKGYNNQLKVDSTSYDLSKIDKSVQTQRSYQQDVNRNAINLQKSDITKPDFNRPDRPDITKQDYKTPTKQIKPTYDFGKPDVPDQNKPKYETAETPIVKYGKPDISKPNFNRPDYPDALSQVYNKQSKPAATFYDFSKIDQFVKTQQNIQQDRFNIGLQKSETSKQDFSIPDQPGNTVQDYREPAKQIKATYDFGKPDVPDQYKPSYESANKRVVLKPGKPDISKPDFNRPDKPDTSQQVYKQQQIQVNLKYDFGRPDVPDQNKPSNKSGGKPFVVKAVEADISKPDFIRAHKPDTLIQGYNKQRKQAASSYDFGKIDKSVQTQQSFQQAENRNNKGQPNYDMLNVDFNRPDQADTTKQNYKIPAKQLRPTYAAGLPNVPDHYKPSYESAKTPVVVNPGIPDIPKPDFNTPEKAYTPEQDYKQLQNQNQVKPTYESGRSDGPVQNIPSYKSAGKTFVVKEVKPDIPKPDFNRLAKPDALSQGYKNILDQVATSYESNIKQNFNTPQQVKTPAEKRINLNSFKVNGEPAVTKTDIKRPDANHELNFQNLNQESANLVLNALKKLRLLSSNKAKSGKQYETGRITLNNRNINKQTDITQDSIKSNGQESKIQTNFANLQVKQTAGGKQTFSMDEKSISPKAGDVYNSQPVKLLTKLKSGRPYFSERKDATKQGVLLKDLPVIRDNYTPDKKDNNNVNGGTYSRTSQDINKSVKQVVKSKPYSSFSGTTSQQDLGASLTASADLGSAKTKQVEKTSGIQEIPAGQEQNNVAYESSKSQPADVTGGLKVNCSVISPCCGDDDYTYLSECFLPPNVKKVCDGFCPCPAPGQPSGPATWLVPRTSSENSISKSPSFIKTPSAQPSAQLSAANKQNTPIVASQNEDSEASQGVDYQSSNVYSAAAKQSAYKTLTNNLCALKCKGAKRNPVCTTAGITLNKCIQKCRGAIVACEGACPCRPDMNAQANGRENNADNSNIAALRLLTSNSDDSTDTDGNDNVDPALKT